MTAEVMGRIFKIHIYTLTVNSEGISDAESRRPPAEGVNSMNWVVGHVLESRNAIMTLLGAPPVFTGPETELYQRAGTGMVPPDGGLPLPELLARLERAQEALSARLHALTEAELAAPCTLEAYAKLPGESLAAKLAFLVFHEGYHCGQVGLLRRLLGRPGAIR